MKVTPLLALLALSAPTFAEEKSLFDGSTLTGWTGDPAVWSVEDGAITGVNTAENPIQHNTFLIWEGGQPENFTLTLKFKLVGGNSGIQYRSAVVDAEKHIVGGYQADFEAGDSYTGILYEERGRGILAERGQRVKITQGAEPGKPAIAAEANALGDKAELNKVIKKEDWNEYKIVAKGNRLEHYVNGTKLVEVDDETAEGAKSGVIAFQVHAGPAMKVQFKDVVLETE